MHACGAAQDPMPGVPIPDLPDFDLLSVEGIEVRPAPGAFHINRSFLSRGSQSAVAQFVV